MIKLISAIAAVVIFLGLAKSYKALFSHRYEEFTIGEENKDGK